VWTRQRRAGDLCGPSLPCSGTCRRRAEDRRRARRIGFCRIDRFHSASSSRSRSIRSASFQQLAALDAIPRSSGVSKARRRRRRPDRRSSARPATLPISVPWRGCRPGTSARCRADHFPVDQHVSVSAEKARGMRSLGPVRSYPCSFLLIGGPRRARGQDARGLPKRYTLGYGQQAHSTIAA